MAANNTPLTTYGTTTTTFLTTTISVSSNQPAFTILYPPPGTEEPQIAIFSATPNPTISNTYTPTPLPILVLTDVVGIAINPSGSPFATRTLSQPPPSQATNTKANSATPAVAANCIVWSCWSKEKRIGVFLGVGLGALLVLVLLWWIFFWRPRIKKIRIRRTRPGDIEGGGRGRPLVKIRVRTSMSQTRTKSKGKGRREESLTSSPPQGSRRRDGSIRVVLRSGNGEPVAYEVVRPPSMREFVAPVPIPDGPGRGMEGDGEGEGKVRSRDFAVPVVGAAVGGGVGSTSRVGRRGIRREGDVRVSRGESMRERGDCGSKGYRRDECEERERHHRRRSQINREAKEEADSWHGEMRRQGEGADEDNRRRRRSYAPRDEEDFEVRRARSPGRPHSGRDGAKRRSRSVSPKHRDHSKEKQRKRRDSEGGFGNGMKKLLPLLPLVFGLMSTYGEPKGGWNQYIPGEKRKGKGKLKKNRYQRESARPVGNMREGFNSITPEQGSAVTTLTPSPPPRRRRSTRDWRVGGYDGADDGDFVVYSAETIDGSVEDVTLPYEILEPESPVLRGARTFPMSSRFEERGKDGYGRFMPPPTPPSTTH
ncbi:hypothetical protein IFR05_003091 [Cadophora sp. M221]|nr:hypothetical protein IFR05_003091 [Cadophora sp. M221]